VCEGYSVGCPRRFLLVRYHTGNLEAPEAEAIQDHLAECQPCRCFVRELERRRRKFLERYPADQVVSELLAEAEARARAAQKGTPKGAGSLRSPAAKSAAANTVSNPTIEQYPQGGRLRRLWMVIRSWWSRRRSDRKP
jgi:anti-sigma factor RsiW